MRIISGKAGRHTIEVPKKVTRPTTDRAREALFSILGSDLDQAVVLDLFAGSGALGLEALSRGARSADFVEMDRGAAAVIRRNLQKTGLEGGQVILRDVFAQVRSLPTARYDYIFADPPYAKDSWDKDLAAELLKSRVWQALKPDGRLIIEVPSGRVPEGDWLEVDRRKYGASTLLFLTRREAE